MKVPMLFIFLPTRAPIAAKTANMVIQVPQQLRQVL